MGGHVHGVVDVLQVDGDPGTGGEVPAQELGDLSVHHCALGKAALDGVKKGLRIQPGLFRKGECLSHGAQMDAHHHVVGHLGGAAAAGGPHVGGGLTHHQQVRPDLVKDLFLAAAHDDQGAAVGAGLAAADRRVQQMEALLHRRGVELLNHIGRGGAHVHNGGAGPGSLHDLRDGGLHDGVGGQAHEDDVAGFVQRFSVVQDLAAPGGKPLPQSGHGVVAIDVAAALVDQIACHAVAHHAKAQISKCFHAH